MSDKIMFLFTCFVRSGYIFLKQGNLMERLQYKYSTHLNSDALLWYLMSVYAVLTLVYQILRMKKTLREVNHIFSNYYFDDV